MSDLNVEEIKREATGRLDVVKKTEELQSLVDRIYPGYSVILSKDGSNGAAAVAVSRTRTRPIQFETLTQSQQIESVLNDSVVTLQLRDLFAKLQERGSTMNLQTLMSLLSAGKKTGRFYSFGRGQWGLSKHKGVNHEIKTIAPAGNDRAGLSAV